MYRFLLAAFICLELHSQPIELVEVQVYQGSERVKSRMGSFEFRDKVLQMGGTWSGRWLIEKKEKNYEGAGYQIEQLPTAHGTQLRVYAHKPHNRIQITFRTLPNEYWVGGGEQFSHVLLNGHKFPFWVEEQGIGRGDKPATKLTRLLGIAGNAVTTYAPVPWVFSNKNRAILNENNGFQAADFSKPNTITWTVWDTVAVFHIFYEPNPKALLTQLSSLLGRPQPLPEWCYRGSWVGVQGGIKRCNEILAKLQAHDHPIAALWIQDWCGKKKTLLGSRLRWHWEPHPHSYPNLKTFTDSLLKNHNIRTLGYINPFLVSRSPWIKTAKEKGFLVKKTNGKPYKLRVGGFRAYMIDLTQPDAFKWYQSIQQEMIHQGLRGWMADFGEWIPYDAVLHNGKAPNLHNPYPTLWAKLNHETAQNHPQDSIVFFNRSAFRGSQKFMQNLWAGDQLTSFQKHDGLPSAWRALLTAGLSGFPIAHADIGGYTNLKFPFFKTYKRDRFLMEKWTEMAAFMPIFRTHEGLMPKHNYQFYTNENALNHFTLWAKVHKELSFYWKECLQEAYTQGLPVVRHFLIQYPELPASWQNHHGALIGNDLIIYPFLGEEQIEVFLPKETWYSPNFQQFYSDGHYKFKSQQILVFIRKGSQHFDRFTALFGFLSQTIGKPYE